MNFDIVDGEFMKIIYFAILFLFCACSSSKNSGMKVIMVNDGVVEEISMSDKKIKTVKVPSSKIKRVYNKGKRKRLQRKYFYRSKIHLVNSKNLRSGRRPAFYSKKVTKRKAVPTMKKAPFAYCLNSGPNKKQKTSSPMCAKIKNQCLMGKAKECLKLGKNYQYKLKKDHLESFYRNDCFYDEQDDLFYSDTLIVCQDGFVYNK